MSESLSEADKRYLIHEKIVVYSLALVTSVGLVWIVFFIKYFWDIDLVPTHKTGNLIDDRWDAARDFYASLGISLVAIGVFAYFLYQATGIIRNAVEVTGRVVEFSILKAKGKTPIAYAYEFNGGRYERRIDVKKSEAEQYRSDPRLN